ncbi:hypothetical protein ALP05_03990 [Pseudomonas caricapapayae]|uniref:Uncharacterized protein n=1 Tax=Pseudomonas caricapapayae TaxID=46678 RepID=A0A3M6EUZ2_9PSED|nr:hypothetical protein [Pseudomonas caricapapayae]RMV72161.1 hypothetical protein ALP05_03990 [Pseudomonas caricapapayae]
MKKFTMGAYGVELTQDQRHAVDAVLDNYNISNNPEESFRCPKDQLCSMVDEILIALECVKEPMGGF